MDAAATAPGKASTGLVETELGGRNHMCLRWMWPSNKEGGPREAELHRGYLVEMLAELDSAVLTELEEFLVSPNGAFAYSLSFCTSEKFWWFDLSQ